MAHYQVGVILDTVVAADAPAAAGEKVLEEFSARTLGL